MSNTISVRKVSKYFGDFMAVNALSLEVAPGSIFGLLGSSGAGKTTTIRLMIDFKSLALVHCLMLWVSIEELKRDPPASLQRVAAGETLVLV